MGHSLGAGGGGGGRLVGPATSDGARGGKAVRRPIGEGVRHPADDPAARRFWLEGFRDYLSLEAGTARHTVENYARDVRRLVTFLLARQTVAPAGVTPQLLREFVFYLKDLGLAPSSIRRQVSALRSYFRFLVGEGYLTLDPTVQLETPKAWRKLPLVLAVSEVEALLAAPGPDDPLAWRDRALLEVAYGTGVRVSELVGLTLTDILFEEGLVRVLGKGSKERLGPIEIGRAHV